MYTSEESTFFFALGWKRKARCYDGVGLWMLWGDEAHFPATFSFILA